MYGLGMDILSGVSLFEPITAREIYTYFPLQLLYLVS